MSPRTFFPGRGTLIEETLLEGKAEGKAEGEAQGRADERAHMILRVLGSRLILTPLDVRERITGCTDLDTLGVWLDRAFTVANAEDLFADER